MRIKLLAFTLAVLTIGLLGSCRKINERLDKIDRRIDGIESNSIATINQQIVGINSSIADLGTIRQNIQNLIETTDGQAKDIADLEVADAALGARIDDLKAYVGETLKSYAQSKWVEATFATLEQHKWTCDTIAKIDARIGALDAELSKSIEDCASSLKSWVNTQIEGYYTAAQMDAKVSELLAQLSSASGESQAKADSLAKELTATKKAIETAKVELTEEYQSAIEEAIKTSEGKLSSRISSGISSVNSKVSALADRVDALEDKVDELTDKVDALEQMIQSVTLLQAYSDGSVSDEDGELKLDLIISPASAASGLAASDFKVLVTEVKTKASSITTLDVDTVDDNGDGNLTLTVDISDCTPATGHSLAVAVNVVKGISDLTTKFVPVSVSETPIKTIADVLSTVEGGFPQGKSGKNYPTIPSNAWACGSVSYVYVYPATGSSALIFHNPGAGGYWNILANTSVTPGEDCYTATKISGQDTTALAFKMTAGKLTSINFSSTNNKYRTDYGGDYVASTIPACALPGVFSVSASKKVCFSKGNLWYGKVGSATKDTWNFETNQYDVQSSWTASHVSHFFWSKSDSVARANTYIDGSATVDDVLFTNATADTAKADFTVSGMKDFWRTLSKDEWQYLLETRTMTNEKGRYSNAMSGVAIGDTTYTGIFLYPDNYNGTIVSSSMTWEQINAAGIVFLPSTGYRSEETISEVTNNPITCIYWTSTPVPESTTVTDAKKNAYRIFFKWDENSTEASKLSTNFNDGNLRSYAVGIRLVTDVPAVPAE